MPGEPQRLPHRALTAMRVLLLGHPVAHSVSPEMMNAAFAAEGMPDRYEALDVSPESLADAVRDLRQEDFRGANVTVPHKLAVMPLMDDLDPLVETMGAVNTIVNRGGRLSGYNTDVEGAWKGLLQPAVDAIAAARVVLAGAGGGARAVIAALELALHRAPAQVVVVARDAAEASKVAEMGFRRGLPTSIGGWPGLRGACEGAKVLINCTPLSLRGEDPFAGVELAGRAVLDLAYVPGGTPLVRRARAEGAWCALQGDQMLLHQGVAAFRLWTGVEAPIEVMRAALQRAVA